MIFLIKSLGPFPSKNINPTEKIGKDNLDEVASSKSTPILIAHPIPRGSTVVATPALSPPQWPNGTSLTIHVDAQYELFNRACAAAGIGSNNNNSGNYKKLIFKNFSTIQINYTQVLTSINIYVF